MTTLEKLASNGASVSKAEFEIWKKDLGAIKLKVQEKDKQYISREARKAVGLSPETNIFKTAKLKAKWESFHKRYAGKVRTPLEASEQLEAFLKLQTKGLKKTPKRILAQRNLEGSRKALGLVGGE